MADNVFRDDAGQKYSDYSPTTTGWYDETQYSPHQRYTAYLVTYKGVADLLLEGREQEIEAESMALLAWAPYDDVAYKAGIELLATGNHPGLAALHKEVYGSGNAGGIYAELNLPKISRSDIEGYNVGMIRALSGDVPTMQTGAFYTPGVFEKVGAWLATTVGKSVGVVQEAMGGESTAPEVTAEDFGPAGDPSLGDVFYTASQYGHSPTNSARMDMRIAAGDIGQLAAEGYMAGVGLGFAMRGAAAASAKLPATGVFAAARGSARSVGQGRPIAQSIVENVNKFKSSRYAGRFTTGARVLRYGSAAIATGTAVAGYGMARFGDLDLDSMLNNLDEDTANTLRETAGYTPAPPGNPGRDVTSGVGLMGARTQSLLQPQENAVARAWQDSQRRP